ncbi:MAG TPA: metallophosphoesterase [Lachnospiraceae bacterium]|nr:metallophosphoesterase [Lachnospiraceae bacterium]
MNILVLADEESKYLWDYFEKSKLDGIDLIISCGDLKPQYLSFLATFAKVPILYVHGNHDAVYDETPPDGCICIDDDLYVYKGIRILGLGGSRCYNFGTYQYTEKEMRSRIFKLRRKLRKYGGFDILATHAPAFELNDGEDLPHRGFEAFRDLLDKYRPKYFLHGHVHLTYNWQQKRECTYNDTTTVINAYERYLFEYK